MKGLLSVSRIARKSARMLACFCAALLLTSITLSSVTLAAESDHDCEGEACPVCQELQACVGNFQLTGEGGGYDDIAVPQAEGGQEAIAANDYRAPHPTLLTLNVRLNE